LYPEFSTRDHTNNPAAEKILSVKKNELINKVIYKFIPIDQNKNIRNFYAQMLENKQTKFNIEISDEDKHNRTVEFIASPRISEKNCRIFCYPADTTTNLLRKTN
jgi:PAS domain-containing protein